MTTQKAAAREAGSHEASGSEERGTKEGTRQKWGPYLRFLKRAKLPWHWYFIYLAASLGLGSVQVYMPQVAGDIMNGNFDPGLVATYSWVQVLTLALTLALALFSGWISYNVDRVLQHSIWKRFMRLPMDTLDELDPSSLPSRLTNDLTWVAYSIRYVFTLVSVTYQLVLILASIAEMNLSLVLIILASIPYTLIIAAITGRFSYKVNDRIQTAFSGFMDYAGQALSNFRLIKISGAERLEERRGTQRALKAYDAAVYNSKVTLVCDTLNGIPGAVLEASVLAYGGILVSRGQLEIGDLVTVFMYLETITVIVSQYSSAWTYLKVAHGATAKVSKLTDIASEQLHREVSLAVPDADIRLRDVSFTYADGRKALDHTTLTIPAGKTTALVGASGSGKSTVLKLVERLYQPQSGQIMFGDEPAERYHLDEWRRAFGYVPQASPLLSGTVRENLSYGLSRRAADSELMQAARIANIDAFINSLPQGLDTPVGSLGGALSGGERQRLAIARMAAKNPDYLLLDEATSNLDPAGAARVARALAQLSLGRTCVVVSHDMRAALAADHVVVLDHGRVKGEGTPAELLATNEAFRSFCRLQNLETSEVRA